MVSYKTYLPTSYLVKVYREVRVRKVGLDAVYGLELGTKLYLLLQKLCLKTSDVINDPPLPLTSKKPLTFSQLERLAKLHGAASFRSAGKPTWLLWQPRICIALVPSSLRSQVPLVLLSLNPGIFSPG